jgi:hypothetical protein
MHTTGTGHRSWSRAGWLVAACLVVLPWTTAAPAGASDTDRYLEVCHRNAVFANGAQPDHMQFEVPDPRSIDPAAAVVTLITFGPAGWVAPQPGAVLTLPSDHPWTSGTVCVGIPNQLPRGQVLLTRVSGRAFGVLGYAYDPEDPVASLEIRGQLDRRDLPQVALNDRPWDPRDQFPAASAGHGFLFLVGDLEPGEHTLCLTTRDPKPVIDRYRSSSVHAAIGCTTFRVK